MSALQLLALLFLLAVLSLAAYADRIYSEMGKFLAREYQENLDAWTRLVEPRLRLSRESAALSASVLRQTALAAVALLFGIKMMRSVMNAGSAAETAVEIVFIIIFFDRMLPQVFFARTKGLWAARVRILFQTLFYLVLPITLVLSLLLSIASLAEPGEEDEEEHPSEGVDALLEAGEEEGILEESDRALVRSVVEFGDKVAREVMTPRPEMFAVPETMTLTEFTESLRNNPFSRVPVYSGTLDNVTGIAFAHDLLQVPDSDAQHRLLREIQRPAFFVPEPKRVNQLLREMQRAKQHMAIVVDEYGAVAGLVTIEDLIEAIVGTIADEHEENAEDTDSPLREESGVYVVPGNFDVTRLRDLLAQETAAESREEETPEAEELRIPTHYEATTVGGMVSEIAGHIPLPGEVVEADGLRFEVLASTSRRVDRVRIRLTPPIVPPERRS
jgi:CBS domain containing-hemolysin-like protein